MQKVDSGKGGVEIDASSWTDLVILIWGTGAEAEVAFKVPSPSFSYLQYILHSVLILLQLCHC